MIPTTRATFKQYCLRKLGHPVIKLNVSDEQVDDRVDEAMKYYVDYHFDGSEQSYFKYQVTDQDKINGYITIPDSVIGVGNLFDIGDSFSANNMFNARYQFMLSFINEITSMQITPYVMAMQYLQVLEEVLVGKQPLRYNRHKNLLYIDMDWASVTTGRWIIVEVFQVIDPEVYPDIWSDRWLQNYTTALIKRQWGSNLTKFIGMRLPGEVQFNGEKIYNDAIAEIAQMENEMINSFSLPSAMYIG